MYNQILMNVMLVVETNWIPNYISSPVKKDKTFWKTRSLSLNESILLNEEWMSTTNNNIFLSKNNKNCMTSHVHVNDVIFVFSENVQLFQSKLCAITTFFSNMEEYALIPFTFNYVDLTPRKAIFICCAIYQKNSVKSGIP